MVGASLLVLLVLCGLSFSRQEDPRGSGTEKEPPIEVIAEPFVRDEVMSVTMTSYGIELHFARDILQLGGRFTLSRPGQAEEQFEPQKQVGAVHVLWPLIGRLVLSTRWGANWGDEVELVFDEGTVMRILPVSKGFRGTIVGKFPPPGTLHFEDF